MKTTKRQFKEFQREFMAYVDVLGLTDWDLFFCHEEEKKNNAWVVAYDRGLKAEVGLATEIEGDDTVIRHAKHEAIELLLMPLRKMLLSFYAQEFVDDEIHKIVNKLMKVKLK